MTSNGFKVTNYAYAGGEGYDNKTITDLIAANYNTARKYVMDTTSRSTLPFNPTYFHISGYAAVDSVDDMIMNLTKLKDFVDLVYDTPNNWGVITFHNVFEDPTSHPESISTADFTEFCEYINTKGIGAVTVQQALDIGTTNYLNHKLQLWNSNNC